MLQRVPLEGEAAPHTAHQSLTPSEQLLTPVLLTLVLLTLPLVTDAGTDVLMNGADELLHRRRMSVDGVKERLWLTDGALLLTDVGGGGALTVPLRRVALRREERRRRGAAGAEEERRRRRRRAPAQLREEEQRSADDGECEREVVACPRSVLIYVA